jgi:SOS-response transcriptional repressor LexA
MPQLTRRQAQLLNILHNFISEDKYSLSQRELAASLGHRGIRSAQLLIDQLERKGYIARTPGISRGLRIVAQKRSEDE